MLQLWTNNNNFDQHANVYEEVLITTQHHYPTPQEIKYFDLDSSKSVQKLPTEKEKKEVSGTEDYNIPTIEHILPRSKEKQYSEAYTTMRLNSVLADVSKNLDDWVTNGIDDSVISVYNIKKILEDNSYYFEQSAKARLLSAALELIFENNIWDNIPLNQVSHLSSMVKNFQKRDFDVQDVFVFLKNMKQTKIQIMKPYNEKKEEA